MSRWVDAGRLTLGGLLPLLLYYAKQGPGLHAMVERAPPLTAAGLPLQKSEVVMGEGSIRRTGEFDVIVHLHADVEATVKVVVVPEA